MRISVLVLMFALVLSVSPALASEGWLTDFAAAQAAAKEKNVPILVDFSGSDWCGWCIRLDEEVFSQPEFKSYAADNLVLFMADFPRKKKLDEATVKQNTELRDKFQVRGYPTVVLLDAGGNELARTGYQKGGAAAYVEHLKSLLSPPEPSEAEGSWLTDFAAAQAAAKEKNVPILADFSGSDWCGWCVKLDQEVFSQEAFQNWSKDNVVMFLADFPQAKPQSAELKKQNKELAEKYGIEGFPTVLLLDAEGNVLQQTGYQAGGAEKYVEHLKELLKK